MKKFDAGKCDQEVEQVRDEIAEREARLQEKLRRIRSAEKNADEEITVLQAGEDRGQLCISVQRMFRSGLGGAALHRWAQARQQIQALQEFNARCEVFHQAPVTPVPGGARAKGSQPPNGPTSARRQQNWVFWLFFFFYPARYQNANGESFGGDYNSPRSFFTERQRKREEKESRRRRKQSQVKWTWLVQVQHRKSPKAVRKQR